MHIKDPMAMHVSHVPRTNIDIINWTISTIVMLVLFIYAHPRVPGDKHPTKIQITMDCRS